MSTPLAADIELVRAVAAKHVRSEHRLRANAAATLHDQVAQTIVAARLKASLMRRELPLDSADLDFVVQRLDDALDQVRTLSQALASPVTLQDVPLDAALGWFVRDAAARHGVSVGLSVAPDCTTESVTPIARFGLFEALSVIIDAIADSKESLTIAMSSDATHIAVAVHVPRGVDIVAMAERASWCGLTIARDATTSTNAIVRVPTQSPIQSNG